MRLPGLLAKLTRHRSEPSSTLPDSLRDETLKFKTIIDNINEGVIMIDDQQVIRLMNPGAATICGWPVEEATGINAQAVIQLVNDRGEPYDEAQDPFHRIFATGQSLRVNSFLVNRSKKQVAISLSLSPLLDNNKQVTAAVAVLSDVSEQHAEEQQRADFISTASHEMRTPVAAIEGYLALALNEKVATIDNRARGYLEKAHNSTQHLGKLFQDLLTSARAEDGRLASHPTVVELGEFLEQLVGDLRLVAEKKGLFIEFLSGASSSTINATHTSAGEKAIRPLYYVYADSDRLREVITNLFDNAVKYTPEGKISIGLTGNDKISQCYVSDTGPGIPADDLPHLFQKFYRVDNSATRTIGGTGLGLFICRKIIEMYNGRIWVESKVGHGSTFYINLPRLSSDRAEQMANANSGDPVQKPNQSAVAA